MEIFGDMIVSFVCEGLKILYPASYCIAVVVLALGAYKMLCDGASGMEALVVSLRRLVIAVVIIAFSATFSSWMVTAVTGETASKSSAKTYGLSSDLFNVEIPQGKDFVYDDLNTLAEETIAGETGGADTGGAGGADTEGAGGADTGGTGGANTGGVNTDEGVPAGNYDPNVLGY